MRVRISVRPETVVWLGVTSVGFAVSILSAREMKAGIAAVRAVSLRRPHAEDVLRMARHNLSAEYGRMVAQGLFLFTGLLALFSRPHIRLGKPRLVERALPWIIVTVEGILVANSANEYLLSRSVLKRRAAAQRRSAAGQGTATLRAQTPNQVR